MKSPIARSSAIHRIVPLARSPAIRNMTGPSAASRTGIRHGFGDVHRAVHAVGIVLDINGSRSVECGVEHLEVIAHQVSRSLVRQAQLTVHDPIVRWADSQRESAPACQLGRQRLLRHRHRMARLDGYDGAADLDAVGYLAQQCDRGHGVEVTGNLWNPKRGEARILGALGRRRAIRLGGQRVGAPCRSRPSDLSARAPAVRAHSGSTRGVRPGETVRRRAGRCPLHSNASRGRAGAGQRWRPGRRRGSSR